MPHKIRCADENCTDCRSIVERVYNELRRSGENDRAAFEAALHVLKLRHPGHGADYYRERAAAWIDAD
jgi:hypothetical protein